MCVCVCGGGEGGEGAVCVCVCVCVCLTWVLCAAQEWCKDEAPEIHAVRRHRSR